jgi:hypothetical protein
MKVILFGTGSCHLCEQAKALLHSAGVTAEHIDIAEDDVLLERYGDRIPVLLRADNGVELDWPFNVTALEELLAQSTS